MKNKKVKLAIVLGVLLIICIGITMLSISRTSIDHWYQLHRINLQHLLLNDNKDLVLQFLKKQRSVVNAWFVHPDICCIRFRTENPEASLYLIVSNNPLSREQIKEYILLEQVEIDALWKEGIFQKGGIGFGERGYLEYRLLDKNCLYCYEYLPT